ncbi:MAG: SDR family NAD(P)-dependent oxidoreductase [Gemmatimonadaceae bacterium]|nr:SDR family NAD(P)-dependent oxidoreductase [Chitinophagaceae bacterium]
MKTAIVTGATGNLGRAVVKKLLADGYRTIGTINSRATPKHAENYEELSADLENESESAGLVEKIIEKHQEINLAVLTVGGFAMGKLAETGSSDILKQYKLNFETAYHIARPVFQQMVKQGHGRIFMVGSKPGLNPAKGKAMIGYALAKSLVFHLAEILNEEAGILDIVTSVIVPGTIDTPQNRESMPDADYSKWVSPEAIADAISFYSSDQASAIREPIIKLYNRS